MKRKIFRASRPRKVSRRMLSLIAAGLILTPAYKADFDQPHKHLTEFSELECFGCLLDDPPQITGAFIGPRLSLMLAPDPAPTATFSPSDLSEMILSRDDDFSDGILQ
jgi:hypothetical protein